MNKFQWMKPGKLVDRDLELVLVGKMPADQGKGYVPQYEFEMRRPGRVAAIGTIRLRIGSVARLRYAGHIGYRVEKEFRGHRYAARSCNLLLPFAAGHGLSTVWLTVDSKNIPSKRTCEIIGAGYVDTIRIPSNHEIYKQGARYRRRYRLCIK